MPLSQIATLSYALDLLRPDGHGLCGVELRMSEIARYLTKRACLNVGAAEHWPLQLRVKSTDATERTKRGGAITEGLFHNH
jgi:hypothetical protein